jgi:hypothetical protein
MITRLSGTLTTNSKFEYDTVDEIKPYLLEHYQEGKIMSLSDGRMATDISIDSMLNEPRCIKSGLYDIWVLSVEKVNGKKQMLETFFVKRGVSL